MSSISGVSTGCLPRVFFGVVSPVFTRLRSWSRGTLSSRAIAETFAPSIRAALIAAPHSTKVGGRSRLLCEKLSIFGTLQTGPDSVATHCTEEEYPTWLRARFHGLSSSMRTFKQLSKIPTETNFFLELFTNPPLFIMAVTRPSLGYKGRWGSLCRPRVQNFVLSRKAIQNTLGQFVKLF